MRSVVLLTALLSMAAPALAQAPEIHRGQVLRDAKNARVGVIDSVGSDGTLGLVIDAAYFRIPADSVSVVDGKLVTKLTKREIQKR